MNFLRPGQGITLISWTAGRYLLVGVVVTYAGFHFATATAPRSQPHPDKTEPGGGVRVEQTNPEKTKQDTDIDIVAIHGLDTRSPDTWTWKDPDDTENKEWVNWLEHPEMLPKDVPRARIFTCDWPAAIFQPSDLVQKRIEEHGRCLLEALQLSPLAVKDRNRPLFFIASCLGGIILLETLMMDSGKAQSIQNATKGIVFLATPFRGTSFQDVAAWAEPSLYAWAVRKKKQVNHLLGAYAKGSALGVEKRAREFTELYTKGDEPYELAAFYEKGKTSLWRRAFPFLPDWLCTGKQLVDESSATLEIISNPIPLDRPHILMNKFKGPECYEYKMVAGKIADMVAKICNKTPLARADDFIRHEHYTTDRLKIERLSGDTLSMDQCYINLAIVEQSGYDTAPSEEGSNKGGIPPQISRFSLSARLRIEIPDGNMRVELSTLFKQRKGTDGSMIKPRRIRIRGRAGVGKTTLCKKMVNDFARDTWQDLFDRILWVPLRNLKTRKDEPCNFGELFYHEYFHRHSNDWELVRQLWDTLKATKGSRTLFILDGLDEVTQDLSRNGKKFDFLLELLNQPNVIITSRPYGKLPAGVNPLDLDLETIGFYPDQVKEYIEKAVCDRQKADEIQSFLRHRLLVADLVRIPILLDALCFTWEKSFKHDPIQQTMTGIYQAIELRLWKKDALRLEKTHGGETVTREQIKDATQIQTERLVKDEISFLEHLAFTGLHNDLIDFKLEHRHAILDRFTPSLLLDKTLPSLSFLRTSDPSTEYSNQSHHFLHNTFQEYFAARYFVQHWTSQKELECLNLSNEEIEDMKPASFLRKHKYDIRYDIFWRFVTGLLHTNHDKKPLHDFFDTVEKEPRDLLGPTHQRLVMHCLSEVVPQKETNFAQKLEERLLHWVLFECDLTGQSLLAREAECPESVILGSLESERGREGMLDALQHSRAHLSTKVFKTLVALLKDERSDVRWRAAGALGGQSQLSQEVVTALVTLLKDEDSNVRWRAGNALSAQSKLPQEAVTALVALLKDEDNDVRSRVAGALSAQSKLPQEAVTALVALLKDKDNDVRWRAADALKGQSQLSQEVVTVIVALLKDESSGVRSRAVDALSAQSELPQEVVTVIVELVKDKDNNVPWRAVNALRAQSQLPQEVVTALVALLKDEDSDVRSRAAFILSGQSQLSQEVVTALVALLKDKDNNARSRAVNTLSAQSKLPQEAVTAIVELVKDKDNNVPWRAVNALRAQSQLPQEVVTALVALLKDEDSDVRSRAAFILSGQSQLSQEVVTALVALLKDKDNNARSRAVNTLSAQSQLPQEAVTALVALLKDKDNDVRWEAVNALKAQSKLPQKAVTAIVELVKDEDNKVRWRAVDALRAQSQLPQEAVTALVALLKDEDSDVRSRAAFILSGQSQLSQEVVTALVALLKDEDNDVRWEAVNTLSAQSKLSQEAVTAIVELVKDEDNKVRWRAVDALGAQSQLPQEAVTALVALLKDKDNDVRSRAAGALRGQSKLSQEVVTALVALLKDEDNNVRWKAVDTLRAQSQLPQEAVTALVALLKDEDSDVRSRAAFILSGQSQLSQKVVTALVALLKDEDSDVRSRAVFILSGQSQLSQEVVTALVALLKDEDNDVRWEAVDALSAQSQLSEEVVTAIVALLKDERSGVRWRAVFSFSAQSKLPQEAATAIVALLKDEDSDVRSRAVNALSAQSKLPQEAATAIVALLKDEDSDVRSRAVNALSAQSKLPQEAVTALVALLKDKDNDVRSRAAGALRGQSKLSQEVVTAIVALLKDEDNNVRWRAVDALGAQSQLPQEAVTALVALLKDKDNDVRSRAAGALRGQSQLSDMTFEALRLMESEKSAGRRSICNIQYVESLYGIWLRRSFEEQLSLYISNGNKACIVNQVNGLRMAYFEDPRQYDQFLKALHTGRQVLADGQRQDLWGDCIYKAASIDREGL